MNYIFISPAYPVTCTHFCKALSDKGVNVLGIGDVSYDELNDELKKALSEYYYVDTLEDYDQVYRAAAFFIHKYGRIDWLESMNEYWLPQDARLREDFNIAVGARPDETASQTSKSGMKKIFIEAGIPTARQSMVTDLEAGLAFAAESGYPLIVKPDIGVGANGAMKLENEEELRWFYEHLPDEPYVMEQFLPGDIYTYDAVIDSHCEPLFESVCTYPPVVDSVQNDEDIHYYTMPEVPEELRRLGRATVKAFGADSRFVHFEFIRLTEDLPGVGKKGGYAAMEVNMRPAGGHDPDMMNYAQSTDVFRIYAEMATSDSRSDSGDGEKYLCAYAARKDGRDYAHSPDDIIGSFYNELVMHEEMPPIDWPSMGRYVYMARFKEMQEMQHFFEYVLG